METKQIGKHIFHVGNIAPRRCAKVAKRLTPIMSKFIDAAKEAGGVKDEAAMNLVVMSVLASSLTALPDDDLDFIMDAVASATRVQLGGNGGAIVDLATHGVDATFTGDMKGLIEWVVFGLKVNLGPLFSGLGDIG